MKKIFIIFSALFVSAASFGQGIINPGMEAWHSATAGGTPPAAPVPIAAPNAWHGFDSLIIAAGQAFGPFIGSDPATAVWNRQLFEENTFVHGGAAAAKLITVKQDTLGFMPGMVSDAEPTFNPGVIAGGGDPASALSFTGGTSTNLRVNSVTAWVAYMPGKDATTGAFGGDDKGLFNVQALATVGSKTDSVVGLGGVNIDASSSYTSVTANVTYTTTDYNVHTIRITFSSGGGGTSGEALDSSILYVDDVSMLGDPQSVGGVAYNANVVRVYPNPSEGILYLEGPALGGYTCTVSSVTGSVVATQTVKGTEKLDLTAQPAGLYLYTIVSPAGETVQTGKVSIRH
ncbi:hypothetical protein GCM10023093_22670 [Nemorincola caseinilytica]|uniref:Secretion system C-terminal sorting domain-containing protein n=1 Tax=Nemorincola caseinilytica TaxID=2054315 RepID=A0ABP8NGY6_9BACT